MTIDIEAIATEIALMHRRADSAHLSEGESLPEMPVSWLTGVSDCDQDVRVVRPDWKALDDKEREDALYEIECRVIALYTSLDENHRLPRYRADQYGSVYERAGSAYVFCGKLNGRSLAEFIADTDQKNYTL